MLSNLFLICAVVGGTVFVCQFVLSLFSLGGHLPGSHATHLPTGHATHLPGGHVHTMPADHSLRGTLQNAHAAIPHGGSPAKDGPPGWMGGLMRHALGLRHATGGAGETWLAGMVSFQGIVAAVTAFGLAGMAALSMGWWTGLVLLAAAVAGAGCSALTAGMLQWLMRQQDDGTVQTADCVGATGTVYLSVPATNAGMGKVLIHVQGRTMEYAAITWVDRELATGEEIIVVGVHAAGVLEIAPAANVPIRVEL